MNVSGGSMSHALATEAANVHALNVASQIGIAVLNQIREQQLQQAAALLEMIQDTPAPIADGVSQYIDVYA